MRDAREHQRAVGFELFEILHHLVETAIGFGGHAHAALGQRLRRLARADLARGHREPRERPVHETRDERRAEQRERQREHAPAGPLQAGRVVELIAVERDPVIVVVDLEADPHAVDVVHALRDDGVVAEAAANVVFDQPVQRLVGLELVLVGCFARVHAHPFIAFQILQQRAPQVGIGIEECGARELDDRDELQSHALRARLAFDHPEALEPRGETDCDQQRDQQKGPPEKAAERERQEAPVDPHGPFLSEHLYGTE